MIETMWSKVSCLRRQHNVVRTSGNSSYPPPLVHCWLVGLQSPCRILILILPLTSGSGYLHSRHFHHFLKTIYTKKRSAALLVSVMQIMKDYSNSTLFSLSHQTLKVNEMFFFSAHDRRVSHTGQITISAYVMY